MPDRDGDWDGGRNPLLLIMCILCPRALAWISPVGPPLLPSSLLLSWLFLSAVSASLGYLGSIQIVPRISIVKVRP